MAKNQVKVKLNSKGAGQLLNGKEVTADMDRRAKAVAAAAEDAIPSTRYKNSGSEGFRGDGQPGKKRARGLIGTTDYASRVYNGKYNALLKGLEAGR